MRLFIVCLLGFFAITLAAPSAEANSRRPEARTGKVVKPVQASATRAAPRQAAARAPARAQASRAQASRAPARAQASTRTAASRNARPAATRQQAASAARNANRRTAKATASNSRQQQLAAGRTRGGARLTSWQSGLPAAEGEQRDCPAGTMSTLARGHDDIVRCMPL